MTMDGRAPKCIHEFMSRCECYFTTPKYVVVIVELKVGQQMQAI